uniref:Insulin-like domain-containing protein n=1 Tax=Sipha flava TaxID=143950 RepID=A0A2S2QTL1_9HEMI
MKARLNLKVTIFLFLLFTMTIIPTNGNNSIAEKDGGLDWNRPYYICGEKLIRAVSIICHFVMLNGISKDFHSLIEQSNNTCCSHLCTLNSLKMFCDYPDHEGI